MSSSANCCTDVLRRLVVQNLSLFLYDDAKFYAERLFYEDPQPENLHLLGQTYFRQGKVKQTYLILQHSEWATNRYLFALSCLSLGKLNEAERALLSPMSAKAFKSQTVEVKDLEAIPGGAAGLYLLGVVCRREQRKEAAIDYFQKSLRLDPAMWGSINELIGMGVTVNTAQLYGMDTAMALRSLCREEPSVAISSGSSSQSSTALYQEPDNENCGVNSASSDVERHRVAIIERRRIAESLSDASSSSPRTAMSLGLSSLSLRIPFATPGSVPYALPVLSDYSLAGPRTGIKSRHPETPFMGHTPGDFMGEYKFGDYSGHTGGHGGRGGGGKGDESDFSRSLADFDADMRPKSARVALFEKSLASPGLTPIGMTMSSENSQSSGLTPACQVMNLRSGQSQSPGAKEDRATPTALFPDSNDPSSVGVRYGEGGRGSAIEGGGGGGGDEYRTGGRARSAQQPRDREGSAPGPPASSQLLDQRAPAGLPPRVAFKDSNAPTETVPAQTGSRRVSFGPTARLSFSSLGRGMGGTGAGIFGEGEGDFDTHSKSASTVGSPIGPRDGDLRDEHPIKFQRCLDRESGSNRDLFYRDVSTPGDPFQYADSTNGADPDTPYVRGYSKNGVQGPGPDQRRREMKADGDGDVSGIHHGSESYSPIPLANTPFPGDREGADFLSFSTTVDKPGRGQGEGEGGVSAGKEDAQQYRTCTRTHSFPLKDEYDVSSSLKEGKERKDIQHAFRDRDRERDIGHPLGDANHPPQRSSSNSGSSKHLNRAGSGSDDAGVERTLSLLTVFTNAYQLLCSFRCRECVALLHRLPRQHYLCGWVQHMLGKAYCEVNEYQPAALALREMLRLEPFRVQGTETLSTALWHLKKDKELCSLATQVVEVDIHCPQTWCVVGNCFSLQKEPEVALKYFSRALQIDPTFTYAHTLYGHELANNEDLDKAVQSFRNSLLNDDRHYTAWYGLGSIYFRQEKYEMAEYHFRRALAINSVSSVLRCYLSMALHAQNDDNKSFEALDVLIQACKIDPKNPQLQYQRAHVLVALDHYEDAVEALDLVLTLAPKEPPVYSLLGQVHRTLGNSAEALKYFDIAISLDPKEGTALKAITEFMEEPLEVDGVLEGYLD